MNIFLDLREKLIEGDKLKFTAVAAACFFGLAMLYIVDVWLIGTTAAAVQGLGIWLDGHKVFAGEAKKVAAAASAFNQVSWYWQHPFRTAWAWATMSADQLSNPGVRVIWIWLNVFLAAAGAAGVLVVRIFFMNTGNKDDRDIEKLNFKKVRFDTGREISRTLSEKIFLGLDDRRRPVCLSVDKLPEHIHILGGSGTGKTSLAVLPVCIQAMRRDMAVIVIDFKGDKMAIQALAREAKLAGKKFYMFSLHPEIRSNTYNPLNSGNTLSKVERIMTALELVFEGAARFYTYCQQAVFLELLTHFEGVKCTLRDVKELLRDPKLVEKITGDEITPEQVKGLTAALTPYSDLDIINDPEPDIDLGRIMNAGDVVYFDLRSAIAPELSTALGKMIAMDLQGHAAFRTPQSRMALVAIDEFQNMVCPAFRNIVSKVRSANYALVLANQALGDLQAVGNDFLNTIVTNTRTKIIFCIDDPADAEYFARSSGQVVIPVESRNKSTSRPEGQLFGGNKSDGESVHEHEKCLLHANIFLKLPFGKSIIFQRGELAVLTNHSHLFSMAEKDRLEGEPYPEPERINKRGVKTVADTIYQIKSDLVVGRQEDKPPAAVPATNIEAEEISL